METNSAGKKDMSANGSKRFKCKQQSNSDYERDTLRKQQTIKEYLLVET